MCSFQFNNTWGQTDEPSSVYLFFKKLLIWYYEGKHNLLIYNKKYNDYGWSIFSDTIHVLRCGMKFRSTCISAFGVL